MKFPGVMNSPCMPYRIRETGSEGFHIPLCDYKTTVATLSMANGAAAGSITLSHLLRRLDGMTANSVPGDGNRPR